MSEVFQFVAIGVIALVVVRLAQDIRVLQLFAIVVFSWAVTAVAAPFLLAKIEPAVTTIPMLELIQKITITCGLFGAILYLALAVLEASDRPYVPGRLWIGFGRRR